MEIAGKKIRGDLLYPELSYKVVGVIYDVYNKLEMVIRREYIKML
jgi:hypothetical protein